MKDLHDTQRLNQLLREARTQDPVMSLDEVKNIVAAKKYASAATSPRLTLGLNTLLYAVLISSCCIAGYIWHLEKKGAFLAMNDSKPHLTTNKQVPFESISMDAAELTSARQEMERINNEIGKNSLESNENTSVASINKHTYTLPRNNKSSKNKFSLSDKPTNNSANSTNYTALFSKNNKMVVVKIADEQLKEITVDGKPIPFEQQTEYLDLIQQGIAMARAKQEKKAANASMTEEEKDYNLKNNQLIKAIQDELLKEDLIKDSKNFDFMMSHNEVLINGQKQPKKYFDKFKQMYEQQLGRTFGSNAIYKFKRGQ